MNGLHFGVRFWTPKRGCRFVGKIVGLTERKKAQVSIVSSCTRQKFPIPLGFQGFAAPRVLVLHTLRTLMSTHVLELFKSMCGHTCLQGVANNCSWRCKIMETQRYARPVVYPRRQSKLALFFARRQKFCRQNDPRFGVRFWTPKRGPSRPDTSKSN